MAEIWWYVWIVPHEGMQSVNYIILQKLAIVHLVVHSVTGYYSNNTFLKWAWSYYIQEKVALW